MPLYLINRGEWFDQPKDGYLKIILNLDRSLTNCRAIIFRVSKGSH